MTETRTAGIRTSSHENDTASATFSASSEMIGKMPRAYHFSTTVDGKMPAQDAIKVRTAEAGKIQPKWPQERAVNFPKFPNLLLTIGAALC